jgi:HEAT repeat protein
MPSAAQMYGCLLVFLAGLIPASQAQAEKPPAKPRPVTDLVKDLDSAAAAKRQAAAAALGTLGAQGASAQPTLLRMLCDPKEDGAVRAEAAVALSVIGRGLTTAGNAPEGSKIIPKLVEIIQDAGNPVPVRERTLWVLRQYPKELTDRKDLFKALSQATAEPAGKENKMLRYDAAFMLAAFWREKAPKAALDVLLEFLKDNTVKIFQGAGNAGGDGRVMAILALRRIGPDVVRRRPDIMRQVGALRNSPDRRLQQEVSILFTEFGP